jgi:hypothetical protein
MVSGLLICGGLGFGHTVAGPGFGAIFLGFAINAVVGAGGSYLLHEVGHAFGLGLCRGVDRVDLRGGFLRFSLMPHGTLTGSESLLVAVLGPGSCVLVGLLLLMVLPVPSLGIWYVAHVIFLVPPFGDGLAVVRSVWRNVANS